VARTETGARKRQDERDGISYFLAAKQNGIKTPLSDDYEAEIKRQLDVAHLEEAMEKVRGQV
jgi:hypothetical protein